jgi:DNA polymerase III alpha subunit (gram-positive type)
MLSIGACLVGDTDTSFYAELQPVSDRVVDTAMQIVGVPLEHFRARGRDPREAMLDFVAWVHSVSGGQRPIFVGFNAGFDWSFVNWYLHTYVGSNPFGNAPLDIKAYFMGLTGCRWRQTGSHKIPARFQGTVERTHHALDDAKSQAQMFEKMLRSPRPDLTE